MRRYRQLLILLTVLTANCTHWSEVSTPAPHRFPPRRQVQVWHKSGRAELHGVTIAGDSLVGIPYWQPLTCDSCRRAIAVTDIDSLRSADRETTAMRYAALPFAALGLIAIALSGCWAD